MLTEKQVVELYQEGIDIRLNKFRRRPGPEGLIGEYNSMNLEVILYMNTIKSEKEFGITLLHEFIHARNDILLEKDRDNDKKVEEEAKETYERRPGVVGMIMAIYGITYK